MFIYRFGSAVTRNPIPALTCFALAVLGPGAISAAPPPCPTATLDVYVGFGVTGCTIGALTFSQFKYFAFGNTILPQTDLLITPIVDSNGTGFTITPQGAPPWFATFFGRTAVEIQYIAASTNPMNIFDHLYTEVNGFATPQGFDQLVELYCPGGTTLPPDPTCPGFPTGVQYLFFVGLGSGSATFSGVNSIAVQKDMDANAFQGGNATITSIKNQLNVACQCPP